MSSPTELLGVTGALLAFWAPVWCWASWYVSVPAVVVVGISAAILTHRYRLTSTRVRCGRILRPAATALVLIVGTWTLVLGMIQLTYSVR